MRKRGKNKGFTLIEVIIALAILAVALAPLIANFIVSSKMNLKSRKNLNAMNLAQDMMEGMRAYSASEIIEKLDVGCSLQSNPDGSNGPSTLVGTVLPSNTVVGGCTYNAGDKKYTISAVQTAAGKGNDKTNTYDVDVELIPDTAVYDGKDMAEISTVDQYWNPVYTMSDSDDETLAVREIYRVVRNNVPSSQTESILKGNIQREIKLNMKVTTDALGNNAYSTTVEVVYSIRPDNYGDWHIDASNLTDSVYTPLGGARNISKAAASDCPTAVYLYYTGMEYARSEYDSDPAKYRDVISINNQTGQDITVYLIRTQLLDHGDDTYNDNYRCRVNLEAKKGNGDPLAESDMGWIHLVTNVRYDLNETVENNKKKYQEDGLTPYIPEVTSTSYSNQRALLYYNGAIISEDDYQKYISDGYQKSNQGLLYKVRLTIRDSNNPDKVMATYDGGTVN